MAERSSRNRDGLAIGTRDHLEQGLGRLGGCKDISSVGQDQHRAGDLRGIGHLPIEYQVTRTSLLAWTSSLTNWRYASPGNGTRSLSQRLTSRWRSR